MVSKQSVGSDRREQILEISLQLFAENGYHKTKISDIVREAGVAQGTFYWHFKSKEAIALEIIRIGQIHILEVIAQGYRQAPGTVQDAVKASEALFEDLLVFSQNNKYLMKLLLSGLESEESVNKAILETRIKMQEAFQNNIKRAMELGILPNNDPSLQAALLMSLIEGIIARWLLGPNSGQSNVTKKSPSEIAKEIVRFEFFGLLGI